MQELLAGIARIEEKLDRVLNASHTKREKAAVRKKQYRAAKALRDSHKVPLPEYPVLLRRDSRVLNVNKEAWARVGMRFGTSGADPEAFVRWIVYQWNNECYLKKPVTYSGNQFRVWNGLCRTNYTQRDLVGLGTGKRQPLNLTEPQAQDFSSRPWWDWGYSLLTPVWRCMREMPNFKELPPRFSTGVRVLLGSFSDLEHNGITWDHHESRKNINALLRRFGPDLLRMWGACVVGLRAKDSPPVPEN